MKRISIWVVIGALACPVIFASSWSTPSMAAGPTIETEDVERFYKIHDAAGGHPTAEQLQRDYLDAGSGGLHQFAKVRNISGATIAEALAKHPELYSKAKQCMVELPRVPPGSASVHAAQCCTRGGSCHCAPPAWRYRKSGRGARTRRGSGGRPGRHRLSADQHGNEPGRRVIPADLLAERSAEAPDPELAALGEVLDAPETARDRLPELSAMSRAPVRLAYWAALFGEPDIAAELVRSAAIGGPLLAQYFWEPIMRDARRTETFKQTMRDLDLVDFWRARLAHGMPPDAGRRLRVRLRKGASTWGQMAGHRSPDRELLQRPLFCS